MHTSVTHGRNSRSLDQSSNSVIQYITNYDSNKDTYSRIH